MFWVVLEENDTIHYGMDRYYKKPQQSYGTEQKIPKKTIHIGPKVRSISHEKIHPWKTSNRNTMTNKQNLQYIIQ